MKNDYLKYFHSNVLIILIGILLLIIIAAKDYWQLSISVFGIVSLLLITISNFLWNIRPFQWLFWIDDFSGRYEGKLKYQYRNEVGEIKSGELKHIKLINQNGNRISISSFTIQENGAKSSVSVNKGLHVEKTKDEKHYRLIYNYQNDGCTDQGFSPHYGTDVLKFIKKGNEKVLSGGYYTGRIPFQSKGEFTELKWVSNDLNHEF